MCVMLLLGGCTGIPLAAPPKATADGTPSIPLGVPGEAMEFGVKLRGLTVGRVQVAVGRPGWVDGHRGLIIRSRGASDGLLSMITSLTWELTTTLDLDRGYPIEEAEVSSVVFNGETEHDDHKRVWDVANRDHNLHSAVSVLRGWHSEPGQRANLEVVIADANIGVDVWETSHEYLPAAKARSVRYEGKAAEKYPFAFWLSDDPQRVPLLLRTESKWGEITVELLHYDAPPD